MNFNFGIGSGKPNQPQPYGQPQMGMGIQVGMPGFGVSMNVPTQQQQQYGQPQLGMNMQMPGFGMDQPQVTYTQTTTTGYMSPHQSTPMYNNSLAQQIIAACNNASFDNDKLKAVQTYSSAQMCPVNGSDLATILGLFGFENDKIKALTLLKQTNNVGQMSASDAVRVLEEFGFDNDKMKALEIIASLIFDRMQSAETIVSQFSFANDQSKARTLLMR